MPVAKAGSIYQTREWRRVCEIVKARDGYRCRKCGALGKKRGGRAVLTVQHTRPERVYPHLALDPAFLITLCNVCHGRADGARRYPKAAR